MTLTLIGKKQGMTKLFDEKGDEVVCTVILMEANVVSQVRRKETDKYNAVQLASIAVPPSKTRRVSRPMQGHFKKAGINPKKVLLESRVEDSSKYEVKQEIGADYFADCKYVDVTGISKGKGYQGVMKRYHFNGMPATHGTGPVHRHGGSCGMRSTPGRCLPGQKKAGHMGNERVTVGNLRVVNAGKDGILVVRGAIPGPRGAVVYVRKANKKTSVKA